MTQRLSCALHVALLISLCGVLYFPYLGRVPFFDKGEPREALAVQDMGAVGTHDTATSDGPWDVGVNEKRIDGPLTLAKVFERAGQHSGAAVLPVWGSADGRGWCPCIQLLRKAADGCWLD